MAEVVAKLVHHAVGDQVEHVGNQLGGQGLLSGDVLHLVELLLDVATPALVKGQELNLVDHLGLLRGELKVGHLLLDWGYWGRGIEIVEILLHWRKVVDLVLLLGHHLEVAWVHYMAGWLEQWRIGVHHVVEGR